MTIAGTEITGLDDAKPTRLRREHIGCAFQFFNLLPRLTVQENVLLPLMIAGEKPDRAWLEKLAAPAGLPSVVGIAPRSCPAASKRGWRSPRM